MNKTVAPAPAMPTTVVVHICSGCGKTWTAQPPKSHKNGAAYWCHAPIGTGTYTLVTDAR